MLKEKSFFVLFFLLCQQLNARQYDSSRIYIQNLQTNAGCDRTITLELTIADVDASITLNGVSLSVNAPDAQYQWIDCSNNTPIEGQTYQTFTPTVSANYTVIVSQNDCEETSDCVSVTIIGVNEITTNEIVIFPNSSSGIYLNI